MTSRERMAVAMRMGTPDRVPVMCQLALGHYFLHAGLDAVEIWHATEAFAEALVRLQQHYGFDGILVNLPGRDPRWRSHLAGVTTQGRTRILAWTNGWTTAAPADDNPHVFRPGGTAFHAPLRQVDPDRLFYVEPHDTFGLTYPQSWDGGATVAQPGPAFFPPWHFDTIREVVRRAGPDVSVHGEVFSPFSQWLELLDYSNGLMAIADDPGKMLASLDRLAEGAIASACGQIEAGAHAILISSAFAGAGFISRRHYSRFVLPFERKVIKGIKGRHDVPIYTHTCGAIGDRLDLMVETGTDGIDTLDPPPLGTVDLGEAKRQIAGRAFIKGNIDPVNIMLRGTPDDVLAAACERLRIGGPAGYILSTACSVAPHTPVENVKALRQAIEQWGRPGTSDATPSATDA